MFLGILTWRLVFTHIMCEHTVLEELRTSLFTMGAPNSDRKSYWIDAVISLWVFGWEELWNLGGEMVSSIFRII